MANDVDTLDSRIVHRWLGGTLPNGIARTLHVPPAEVREAIGRFVQQTLPRDRHVATARQLGRLDELIADYWPLAKSGNYKALHAVLKMIMHQNLLLGICQPNTANANTYVQVNTIERQTKTDKIEAALMRLVEEGKKAKAAKAAQVVEQVVEAEPAAPVPAE